MSHDDMVIAMKSPTTIGFIGHPEFKQTDDFARRFNKSKEEELNEEGEGALSADASGEVSQPLFGVQRREMPVEVEEATATTTAGNYEYDVPFAGDKDTLARHNGVGGSVSVNKV